MFGYENHINTDCKNEASPGSRQLPKFSQIKKKKNIAWYSLIANTCLACTGPWAWPLIPKEREEGRSSRKPTLKQNLIPPQLSQELSMMSRMVLPGSTGAQRLYYFNPHWGRTLLSRNNGSDSYLQRQGRMASCFSQGECLRLIRLSPKELLVTDLTFCLILSCSTSTVRSGGDEQGKLGNPTSWPTSVLYELTRPSHTSAILLPSS